MISKKYMVCALIIIGGMGAAKAFDLDPATISKLTPEQRTFFKQQAFDRGNPQEIKKFAAFLDASDLMKLFSKNDATITDFLATSPEINHEALKTAFIETLRTGNKTVIDRLQNYPNIKAITLVGNDFSASFSKAVKDGNSTYIETLLSYPQVNAIPGLGDALAAYLSYVIKNNNKAVFDVLRPRANILFIYTPTRPQSNNSRYSTLLIDAVMQGNTEFVATLLNDPRMTTENINTLNNDTSGNTAFSIAAERNIKPIFDLLLPRSNILHANNNGETALIHAAKNGNAEMMRALLNDPRTTVEYINAQDMNEVSALGYANASQYIHNDPTIIDLLKSKGATE